ncbi:MAG: CvpA family protein [Bacilli bacterium]
MNILDLIIIIFIAYRVLIGFKNGFFKELISVVGFIVIIILSFVFKDIISNLLITYFPFFDFGGLFIGGMAINILVYKVIGFFIIFSILSIILKILITITNAFETLLKFTIILAIPSKVGGAIIGFIYGWFIIFLCLMILNIPIENNIIINSKMVQESTMNDVILNKTPILSGIGKNTLSSMDEINTLIEEYNNNPKNNLNDKIVEILLKYKLTDKNTIKKLIEKGKITITDEQILNKY